MNIAFGRVLLVMFTGPEWNFTCFCSSSEPDLRSSVTSFGSKEQTLAEWSSLAWLFWKDHRYMKEWLHPKEWKLLYRNLARDLTIKSDAIKILLEEIWICKKSYFPRKETFKRKLELYSSTGYLLPEVL